MHPTVSIGQWLAILLLCLSLPASAGNGSQVILVHTPAPPVTAPATPAVLNALVDELDNWLDAHVTLPRPDAAPTVRWISPSTARDIGGTPRRGFGPARAFYDPETGTISLVEPWSVTDPQDVSVLLHELVHHRQVGRGYACPGAEELPAYRAQAAWLAERGLELDVNWIAILLEAGCTPRDIHPD